MVLLLEEGALNLFLILDYKGYNVITVQKVLALAVRASMLELSIFKSEPDCLFEFIYL